MKQTIVCDASSIIYLAKCALLQPFAGVADLVMPQTVFRECVGAADKESPHVRDIEDLVHRRLIRVRDAAGSGASGLECLGPGERSVLELYKMTSPAVVMTDDGRAVKYCRKEAIPFLSSPFVPAILYQEGRISLAGAMQGIDRLAAIGYFSEEVIHLARRRLISSPRLEGVLFDVDGVLLNTMSSHDAAWRRVLSSYGIEIASNEIYLREGEKGSVTAREFLARAGLRPDTDSVGRILSEKEKHFKEFAHNDLFFPGVRRAVELLHQRGYQLALVTGSSRLEIAAMADEPFLNLFGAIVTGDAVTHGKPHPESYRRALESLHLESSAALVVENAPNGIQAARSAGIACIALTTTLPEEFLAGAQWVVKTMADVMLLFEPAEEMQR